GPANVISQGTQEMYRAQVGYPIGYFYGLKTNGIFQNDAEVQAYKNSSGGLIEPSAVPGDVRYVDTNKDGLISQDDATMIGNPNPKYTYGLSLSAEYKGLDFSLIATGVQGVDIMKSYRSFYDSWQQNYTTDIFGRWHGEGTSNRIPRLVAGPSINTQYVSDLYVENGSYLRISNVTLGYDFKKLIKKMPMAQFRLYVAVQNLYTFTKYSGMDPAVGFIPVQADGTAGYSSNIDVGFYPNPRTVMMGASIKF
ncbi:MAG TPA: SusC/RagA family protein, partial [Bacteroidales bacterium]